MGTLTLRITKRTHRSGSQKRCLGVSRYALEDSTEGGTAHSV
jgi:hypothetical protein